MRGPKQSNWKTKPILCSKINKTIIWGHSNRETTSITVKFCFSTVVMHQE